MAHALIVGAGPAGATIAYLLARREIRVTLLERQTDFAREFRGEVLMPSGIEVFAQIGLTDSFDALPHRQIERVQLYFGPRRLLEVSTPFGPRVVPQPAMLEMLVAEASRYAGFAIERGATVRDLIRKDGRVAGVLADTASGTREFRADFVIGTDGRSSVIRRRAELAEERSPQAFDVFWFKVPAPDFLDDRTARAYFARNHLLIAYPTPGGPFQVAWVINKGTFGDLHKVGIDGWLAGMTTLVSDDFGSHLRKNRDSLAHPFVLDVVCNRLVRWSAPGLLMLGDAAHPMSPVGGQGINIALRDAVVAANHLCPALTSDAEAAALDEAARRVQAERMHEVVTIQNLQQAGPDILFRDSLLSRIVLRRPFLALARTRLVQSLVARRFGPFLSGVSEVKLLERVKASSLYRDQTAATLSNRR